MLNRETKKLINEPSKELWRQKANIVEKRKVGVGGSRVNDVFFGHIFGTKRMDRVNQSFDVYFT